MPILKPIANDKLLFAKFTEKLCFEMEFVSP